MYTKIFEIGNIVFYIMLIVSAVFLLKRIVMHIVALFPSKRLPQSDTKHNFAILIPARNESKVIEQLLLSIQNQSYDSDLIHTFVIVESTQDPTCEIAAKFKNTEVFVRQHLERKGKGYALDECLTYMLDRKDEYDAVFIFDADNVLDKNFVSEMNNTFSAGYQISMGYRNSKNWNDGWIASCSALTFSMINTFNNKSKTRFNEGLILSGTGCYIDYNIIKSLGGWKFYSLTEDYELSLYCMVNNIPMAYNEYAIFYDEQPTTLKASWNQRLRWVRGHEDNDKKYRKQLLQSAKYDEHNRLSKIDAAVNLLPVFLILITAFSYWIFTMVWALIGFFSGAPQFFDVLLAFLYSTFGIYTFFVLYTVLMLSVESKHINITPLNAIKCCLMNPFYMALYIPLYFTAITKKQVEWVPIQHNVVLNEQDKFDKR